MHVLSPLWKFAVSLCLLAAAVSTPLRAELGCPPDGRHVLARRWDPVLGKAWETVADCAHPERPARSVAAVISFTDKPASPGSSSPTPLPLLVHAGDAVRLWQQAANVRIELAGVAEQAAHSGERIVVRVLRGTMAETPQVEKISGIVRGAGEVEIEQ